MIELVKHLPTDLLVDRCNLAAGDFSHLESSLSAAAGFLNVGCDWIFATVSLTEDPALLARLEGHARSIDVSRLRKLDQSIGESEFSLHYHCDVYHFGFDDPNTIENVATKILALRAEHSFECECCR
jgi:hypothetical protein